MKVALFIIIMSCTCSKEQIYPEKCSGYKTEQENTCGPPTGIVEVSIHKQVVPLVSQFHHESACL